MRNATTSLVAILLGCITLGCDETTTQPVEQTDLPDKVTGAVESEAQPRPEPDAENETRTEPRPDVMMQELAEAVAAFRQADEEALRLVLAPIEAKIDRAAKAGDLEGAAQLTEQLDQTRQAALLEPTDPDIAQSMHLAVCRRAATAKHALSLYEIAVDHYTRSVDVGRALELRGEQNTLREQLGLSDEQLDLFADPQAQWRAETYEITVDAKANSQKNRIPIDAEFKTGDVLYIFPNPEDKWYTGKYKWVDYRGRMAGPGTAPTMKLLFRVGSYVPHRLRIGYRVIVTGPSTLSFYCEDQWPNNNQGQIRVSVVAMRR